MRKIELLSPAKNLECGIAAINHGADAVYIGAPQFSARVNASNSIDEIEKLCSYAHKFRSKIYVALNTILKDTEIETAQKIIHQLYEVGADALIVQDMAILEMDIPPIALHASTQMDNRNIEKIKFLEQVGFSQVVLARELSLEEIQNITSQTSIPIEVFVHGALCVSYSGQCYLSYALNGRSANRGECAQCCRLPYDLIDATGKHLVTGKHLLSLKDMNRSNFVANLIDAGVSSFKIEGRLKDVDYVKNITAFYRQKIDIALENRINCQKNSVGKCIYTFSPNPEKSFHRGSTDYFLSGKRTDISSIYTPKSIGEKVGTVAQIGNNFLTLKTEKVLNNGDGFCFFSNKKTFEGFRVNRVEGNRIYPTEMPKIHHQAEIYRNADCVFEKSILAENSGIRKIAISLTIEDVTNGFKLTATDEEGINASIDVTAEKETAKQIKHATQNTVAQLSKWGDTVFTVEKIDLRWKNVYFIPNSVLSTWRRLLFTELEIVRESKYERIQRVITEPTAKFPIDKLSYLGNVHNHLAAQFYQKHGVTEIANSFEKKKPKNATLMFCKHCIKYTLGYCAKNGGTATKEPLFLRYKNYQLRLEFDCKNCIMKVLEATEK